MIAEEIIEKLTERLVERITRANLFVIKKIAKKIKEIGEMLPSNAYDIMQIMNYGGDLDEIVKELAKATELNKKDIYKIFEEVTKNDQNFAKKFYEYKGKKFIPWEENDVLRNEVEILARQTANTYNNISDTRGIGYTIKEIGSDGKPKVIFRNVSDTYRNVVDEAIVSVSEGRTTYDEEMARIMKEIGRSGLKYVDYESGYHRRLDSAIAMNLNDGLKQLHNRTQEIFGEEFGSDGIEVSVHLNPAPDHQDVQGKQFSTIKPSKDELSEWEKFQNDEDCVSYDGEEFTADYDGRDRRSISEYNCKHYIFAILLDISKPQYSNEELKKIKDKANEEIEFEGKKYTMYEATQLQRHIELEIRKNKDIQIMGVESNNKGLIEDSERKIDQLTDKYYELSKISGLPTKLERLQVPGYRQVEVNK